MISRVRTRWPTPRGLRPRRHSQLRPLSDWGGGLGTVGTIPQLVIKSKPKEAPRIPLSLGFCCGGFKLCPQILGYSSAQKGAQSPSPKLWTELSGSLQMNKIR